MFLVEESWGENASECAVQAERQWNERIMEGKKAKEKMERKENLELIARDCRAGGEPVPLGLGPPQVDQVVNSNNNKSNLYSTIQH